MNGDALIQIIAAHHGLEPEQVRAYYQDEIELCRAVVEKEREACIAALTHAIECAPPFDGTRAILQRIVDGMQARAEKR